MSLVVGIIGATFILIAFILDEFVKGYDQNTKMYNIMNILGSGCLIYYAYSLGSWPFGILNTVWLSVAAYKLFFLTFIKKKK